MNGLIIQWLDGASNIQNPSYQLPVSYSNTDYKIFATQQFYDSGRTSYGVIVSHINMTESSFSVWQNNDSRYTTVFTIGY